MFTNINDCRFPRESGQLFHCTVEPSPGHIRCWSWAQRSSIAGHCSIQWLPKVWRMWGRTNLQLPSWQIASRSASRMCPHSPSCLLLSGPSEWSAHDWGKKTGRPSGPNRNNNKNLSLFAISLRFWSLISHDWRIFCVRFVWRPSVAQSNCTPKCVKHRSFFSFWFCLCINLFHLPKGSGGFFTSGTCERGVTERGAFAFACQYIVSPRGWTGNRTVTQMRHRLPVEGRPNRARQSLASTLSELRVAATLYCDPGRHANVITPCLLTPCLNVPNYSLSNTSRCGTGRTFFFGLVLSALLTSFPRAVITSIVMVTEISVKWTVRMQTSVQFLPVEVSSADVAKGGP